jgi:hypothetical protein
MNTATDYYTDNYADLEQFDQSYSPQAGRRPGLDVLPDGDYDFEILDAKLDTTPKQHVRIVRVGLRVTSAGSSQGQTLEHISFLNNQTAIDILGSTLCTLGFDADQWTVASGRPFSKELPKALPRMRGLRFRGTKKKNQDGFHNLYYNARLAGMPMPAPAPQTKQQGEIVDAEYEVTDDSQIPF